MEVTCTIEYAKTEATAIGTRHSGYIASYSKIVESWVEAMMFVNEHKGDGNVRSVRYGPV